jgi:hypothetical protein
VAEALVIDPLIGIT